MTRLCAVLGTWQLLMLGAALRQHENGPAGNTATREIVLIYGPVNDEMKELMPRLAAVVRPSCEVIWAEGLSANREAARASSSVFSKQLAQLRNQVGGATIDEIWISKIWDHAEKMVLEAFPTANVVLYEDGLHDYLPRDLCSWNHNFDRPPLIGRLKQIAMIARGRQAWSRALTIGVLLKEHLDRVSRAYFSISDDVPLPAALDSLNWASIDHEILQSVIQDAKSCLKINIDPSEFRDDRDHEVVLFLGQCFSKFGGTSYRDELNANLFAVRELIERGYLVVWKDHPRADRPMFPELRDGVRSDRLACLSGEFSCPIEMLVDALKPEIVVSATSSALFYLPKIAKIQTYFFDISRRLELIDDYSEMVDIVRRHVRPFEELPAQSSPQIEHEPSGGPTPGPHDRSVPGHA